MNNMLVSSKDRENLCWALAGQMNQLVPLTFFVLCFWKSAEENRCQLAVRRDATRAFASVRRQVLQLAPRN